MKTLTKNRLSLIALVLLFLTPLIVAIVMNSKWIEFSPESFKNNGDLIKPPIKITDNDKLKSFEEYWTVVYNHTGDCEEKCGKMFDTLYRIRLTKGHKMKKVKLLVLHPNDSAVVIPKHYNSIESQTYSEKSDLHSIMTKLSNQSLGNNRGLYLISPEGFLMMSYPADFEPRDVIKDLGLVLRARKNEG